MHNITNDVSELKQVVQTHYKGKAISSYTEIHLNSSAIKLRIDPQVATTGNVPLLPPVLNHRTQHCLSHLSFAFVLYLTNGQRLAWMLFIYVLWKMSVMQCVCMLAKLLLI